MIISLNSLHLDCLELVERLVEIVRGINVYLLFWMMYNSTSRLFVDQCTKIADEKHMHFTMTKLLSCCPNQTASQQYSENAVCQFGQQEKKMTRIELQECKHTSREWQTKHEPNMVNSVINVNQGSFGMFSAYTRLDIDIISECTSVRTEPAVLLYSMYYTNCQK